MKALILAAGLGSRLKSITEQIPKAMVMIYEKPLIQILIEKLIAQGFHEIIINLFHFPEQIKNFIKASNNFGINIHFSEESKLLDTGGGLKNASWFFNNNESFLVHNVDIISNLNLKELILHHLDTKNIATLAVSERTTSRYFLFNPENQLCGWENKLTNNKIIKKPSESLIPKAFSGIQIVSPEIFRLMPDSDTFSLTDLYLNLCEKHPIISFEHSASNWFDLGKIEDMERIKKQLGSQA